MGSDKIPVVRTSDNECAWERNIDQIDPTVVELVVCRRERNTRGRNHGETRTISYRAVDRDRTTSGVARRVCYVSSKCDTDSNTRMKSDRMCARLDLGNRYDVPSHFQVESSNNDAVISRRDDNDHWNREGLGVIDSEVLV